MGTSVVAGVGGQNRLDPARGVLCLSPPGELEGWSAGAFWGRWL